MKKRVLALLLVAIMLLTLGGCGKISNDKISIEKYKGLEVTEVAPIKVTDKDVEASIESTLQMMADEIEVTDRAAKEGDTVTIDYLGTYEGERFDSNEGWVLELGSKTTVDGFEEGIMGHNKGETFDMKVTFPKGYGAKTESGVELSEKEVDFKITIQKIVTYDVPELTEELLPELSKEAKTIDEFKAEVKADLEESNRLSAEAEMENAIWEALIDNSELKEVPSDVYKKYEEELENTYGYIAAMYGYDVEEFLEKAYGMKKDTLIENMITQEYAIELIAEEEGLEITLEEYEEGLAEFAEMYGYEDVTKFEEEIGKEELTRTLLQEKVAELLVENCKKVKK